MSATQNQDTAGDRGHAAAGITTGPQARQGDHMNITTSQPEARRSVADHDDIPSGCDCLWKWQHDDIRAQWELTAERPACPVHGTHAGSGAAA